MELDGERSGVISATSEHLEECPDPVISKTQPMVQAEKCLGEKRSEVISIRENLW